MNNLNTSLKINVPGFFKGFASAFDITGQTLLDVPDFRSGFQRDAEALKGDWRRVGSDLRWAMDFAARE